MDPILATVLTVAVAGLATWLRLSKKDKLLEKQWVQQVLKERLKNAVAARMGTAAKMKQANSDGKLSPEEREGLRDLAIASALRATEAVIGKAVEEVGDLHDLVAANVRNCKMKWAASSLAEAQAAQQFVDLMFAEMQDNEDDDDEE